MSETPTLAQTQTQQPQTVYLNAYQVPAYLIDTLHLDFELQDGYTIVKSRMQVRRNPAADGQAQDLILNGEAQTLIEVTLNKKKLSSSDYVLTDKLLTIPAVPEKFELEITSKIIPEKNTELNGLYRSANVYCTQCEAEGFRRITYFPDRPDVLTRFTTTISADKTRYPYLLSNGNLLEQGTLENGRHFAKWEDPFKKPCYLFALVAGDFDLIEDTFVTQSQRKVALRFYVEKGYGEQAHHAVYSLKKAMRWDEMTYGREYDLDIYMVVAIGDFNMGAMENKGLNIFNTKYILAKPETATDEDYIHILSVIGHEYFHNWTGNRVTCRDWFQLSLKEGLTVFRDQTFSEDTLSPVMRMREVTVLREAQFAEDGGPLAHPVRPESYIEINNFYTSTVYNKGAEVLRMLRTILGKELFRKGMDLYFSRHDGHAVTIEDYVKAMEDVSELDLTQFKRWYSQAGTPLVTVTSNYDSAKKIFSLSFAQSCPPTPGQTEKKPFHIPIRMGLLSQTGKALPLQQQDEASTLETVLHLTKPEQTFHFQEMAAKPIPSLLRHFSAPVKLRYDYSDEELLSLFKHDSDPFNRWEAGQQLALRVMLKLVRDVQQNKPLHLSNELTDMFDYALHQQDHDKYYLSELLMLPSEKYIGEQMDVIDVDAIHTVRKFVVHEIAKRLQHAFKHAYRLNQTNAPAHEFNLDEIGRRFLKNRSLLYLLSLPENAYIGMEQFNASVTSNMTDTLAALSGLVHQDIPERQQALDSFYQTWQKDALCLDKWFAIQASSMLPTVLQTVKQLTRHPAFDIKNPNKVYALIGTFTRRNQKYFHAKDGSGYMFLREIVQQLDKLNPQIAGRMLEPLTGWKRYDKERQALMRKELEMLRQEKNLSPDLYELLTKSLA